MTKIVKTVALIILNPIITFGLYIISHGHLTPGGGFQGGVIIASAAALALVVFRKDIKPSSLIFSLLEPAGLVLFIGLAFWGIAKSSFFNNFLANSGSILGQTIQFGINPGYLNSGGVIPLMNLAVGLEVASGLSIVIILMTKNG